MLLKIGWKDGGLGIRGHWIKWEEHWIQALWAPRQCVVSITVLWIKKEDKIAADLSASVKKEMEQLTTMR